MKVQKITLHNWRNVPDQAIDLNGCNVHLLGDNTVGKSNFIKALRMLLNANITGGDNIRHGEKRAELAVQLAEFSNWTPIDGTGHEFRATIKKAKDGSEKVELELIYPDGGLEHRLTEIRNYIGAVPLKFNFVEMSKSKVGKMEQLKIVRGMFPQDFQDELRKIDGRIVKYENERREVGQQKTAAEGFIEKSGITYQQLISHAKPVDVQALQTKEAEIRDYNTRIEWLKEQEKKILAAKQKPSTNTAMQMAVSNIAAAFEYELKQLAPQSLDEIAQQIKDANDHNRIHERVLMLDKTKKELEELEKQYGELDALVKSTRQALADMIRDCEPPIPGLSFDCEQVYYNGMPVDEEHMSTAQIMMLEVLLQMSQAGKAQVVMLQQGESLGTNLLNQLNELCEASDFQLFIEQVERGTEELRVVVQS
jgi:predicted Holliday junction resolvase-like endonuclease